MGEPGTGKTRSGFVVAHVAYNAIKAGGSTTSSPIFRLLDLWRGTFFVDEADWRHSDACADIIKILNAGYMRGLPVLRAAKSGGGDDYEGRPFDVYGPKIIANRKPFDDAALESRCLTCPMLERELRRDIPRQLPEKFYVEAQELRNKLLKWRFDSYAKIKTADDPKLLHLIPRMTQIATPIYNVACDTGFRQEFADFLKGAGAKQRSERPQAVIIEAITELARNNGHSPIRVKAVADKAKELGEDQDFAPTPNAAGSMIRSLGIEIPPRTKRGFEFTVDQDKLDDLRRSYSLDGDSKNETADSTR